MKPKLTKSDIRKQNKLKKRLKKSRLVIRNTPFTATEDQIKERFAKYGNIVEVKVLRKPDGKSTGCCFLQFDRVNSAAKAIRWENLQTFLERMIVVDWAVPKSKFNKSAGDSDLKTEKEDGGDVSFIKEEVNNDSVQRVIEIKEEKDSDSEIKEDISEQNHSDSDEESDRNSADSEGELEDKKNLKTDLKLEQCEIDDEDQKPHHRHFSNDVREGKTVFIKNVPFSASNEDLKHCVEQFGPVYYALICIDKLTEHSKGTAFVKFRNAEDAEKCLAAGTELTLHGQILDSYKALNKHDVNEKNQEKKTIGKDSRNLYLVKEGVILASSPAAQGVSAQDMAKRLKLEQWKSQMLRNLAMFVSRNRLVCHNLPVSCDDAALRQIFKKHSNPGSVITEAKVMRDLKNLDGQGIGRSKEYGFVTFAKHEDALKALRNINNNPKIFSLSQRPIVSFSIENKIMLNARQKRLDRSRQNNRTSSGPNQPSNSEVVTAPKHLKVSKKNEKKTKKLYEPRNNAEIETFAGTTSKPGVTRPLGKNFLRRQASIHSANIKQKKKDAKTFKQVSSIKREQIANRKEIKPKQGSTKMDSDEANFSRLVNNYKNKLSSVKNRSKWYEA